MNGVVIVIKLRIVVIINYVQAISNESYTGKKKKGVLFILVAVTEVKTEHSKTGYHCMIIIMLM